MNAIPSAPCGEADKLGYPIITKAKEATVAQIPAQSASDKSKVTIRVVPVFGRLRETCFSEVRTGSLQSFAEYALCDRILLSTSPLHLVFTKLSALIMPSALCYLCQKGSWQQLGDSFDLTGSLGPLLLPIVLPSYEQK